MKESLKKFIKKHWVAGSIFAFIVLLILTILPTATYSQFVNRDIRPAQLVSLANKDRVRLNLTPLTFDLNLQMAAEQKAQDMARNDYFEHFSPDGHSPWKFMIDNGYIYEIAGENLAIDFDDTEDIEKAWMESPRHQANILNPNYEHIAIATIKDSFQGHKTTIVVQMFGKKSEGLSAKTNLMYYKIRSLLGLNF